MQKCSVLLVMGSLHTHINSLLVRIVYCTLLHAGISAVFRKLINKNGDALAFLLNLLVANVRVQSEVRDSENVFILRDERESRRPAPWFNAFMSPSTQRD